MQFRGHTSRIVELERMRQVDPRGIGAVINEPFHHQVGIVGGDDGRNIRFLTGRKEHGYKHERYVNRSFHNSFHFVQGQNQGFLFVPVRVQSTQISAAISYLTPEVGPCERSTGCSPPDPKKYSRLSGLSGMDSVI